MTNKPEPMPTKGKENVTEALIRDLRERSELGKRKYGTHLETFNGRDPLVDGFQELLDLAQYWKQVLMERGPFEYPEIEPSAGGFYLVFIKEMGWVVDEWEEGEYSWADVLIPYKITHWTYLPGDPE